MGWVVMIGIFDANRGVFLWFFNSFFAIFPGKDEVARNGAHLITSARGFLCAPVAFSTSSLARSFFDNGPKGVGPSLSASAARI